MARYTHDNLASDADEMQQAKDEIKHLESVIYGLNCRVIELKCPWSKETNPDWAIWNTSCGNAFSFVGDGPIEHGMRFCCFCGGYLDNQEHG